MKKGWRNFWIACGAVAGTGVICLAAGKMLGASWTIMGTYFPGWIGPGRSHSAESYDYGETPAEADTEDTYQDIRSLKVDTEGLCVQILKAEDGQVTVKTKDVYPALDFAVTENNGKLEVETTAETFSWKIKQGGYGNVWIYVPEQLNLDEADLQTGMGELYVEDLDARKIKMEIGAGSALIDWFEAETIEAEVGVGQLDLFGNTTHKADLECGVGSLHYTAAGRKEDFNYDLECGVGELNIGDESYSGLSVEKTIMNGAKKEMKVACDVGSTNISFQ